MTRKGGIGGSADLAKHQVATDLAAVLGRLDGYQPHTQEAVRASFEGKSDKEVASALGRKLGEVKWELRQARLRSGVASRFALLLRAVVARRDEDDLNRRSPESR